MGTSEPSRQSKSHDTDRQKTAAANTVSFTVNVIMKNEKLLLEQQSNVHGLKFNLVSRARRSVTGLSQNKQIKK